jgi:tetratricopeptide (TPR) repeat protein
MERKLPRETLSPTVLQSRWKKLGRWSLFAIVFALPFFFLPFTQFPVDAAKIAVASILLAVGLVSFFACVIEERKIIYPRSWLAFSVLVLLLVVAASAWFSTSAYLSWYGKLFQPDSFLAFLAYGSAFFLSFSFFTEDDIPQLVSLFLGGMAVATILNLLQAFGVFWFPWSFAKTDTFYTLDTAFAWAVMMAASLVLAAEVWLNGIVENRKKILLGITATLLFFGLIVVNFEIIWIGLAIILLAMGMQFASRGNFRTPFLFVALAICMVIIGPRIPSFVPIASEVRPDFISSVTVAAHADHAWRLLLGSGPSTFGEQFTRFHSQSLNQTNFWDFPFVQGYDFFVTFLTATGLLGLLAFLGVIAAFVWQVLYGREKNRGQNLIIPIASLLFALCFYPGFFVLMIYLFIMLGFFLADSGVHREIPFDELRPSVLFVVFAIAAFLAACVLSGAYEVGVHYVAAAEYEDGVNALNANNLSAATTDLQRSIALVPASDDAWQAASQVAFASGEQAMSAAGETLNSSAQSAFASAVQAAQSAVEIDPNNVANWENLGSIYANLVPVAGGADTLAREAYLSAEAIDPWDPDLPVSIAQVDIAAASQFSVALDAPDTQKALADAETELNESLSLKPDDPLDAGLEFELGVLLYQNNQSAAAEVQFQRAVALQSNYSNARYFLGLIYANQGMTSAALSQFEAIAQLNPGNAEIQQIITNLQNGQPPLAGTATSGLPVAGVSTSTVATSTPKKDDKK